jgi:putative flippase GtrA
MAADMRKAFKTWDFPWQAERTRLLLLMFLLLYTVLVNGFVCGALSGAFARYQARITWLSAAAAGVAMISMIPETGRVPIPAWVKRLWAAPMAQAVARRIDPAFIRFGLVGAAGFIVDYSVLHVTMQFEGWSAWQARFVSFPVAVAATWMLNRSFTFKHHASHRPWRQAMVYVGVQLCGGAVNIAVYDLALMLRPSLNSMVVIPLAFGAVAGICVNFLGSKHIAFRPAAAGKAIEPALSELLPHEPVELTAQRAD